LMQCGGDADGGGLMSGDEEQHGLLADLMEIQPGAGLVAGAQEQADQVVAGLLAAGGDQRIGDGEGLGESPSRGNLPRSGELEWKAHRAVGAAQHLLGAASDAVMQGGGGGDVVGAEHGAADGAQCHPHRGRRQVDRRGGGGG
jgi:hypothetical protein